MSVNGGRYLSPSPTFEVEGLPPPPPPHLLQNPNENITHMFDFIAIADSMNLKIGGNSNLMDKTRGKYLRSYDKSSGLPIFPRVVGEPRIPRF